MWEFSETTRRRGNAIRLPFRRLRDQWRFLQAVSKEVGGVGEDSDVLIFLIRQSPEYFT